MKATFPIVIKLALLSVLVCVAGCATIYSLNERIPGLDRIFHRFSKAEVGPIKTESGEIVPGTETDSSIEKTGVSAASGPEADLKHGAAPGSGYEYTDINDTELALPSTSPNAPPTIPSSSELKPNSKPVEEIKVAKPLVTEPIVTSPEASVKAKPKIKPKLEIRKPEYTLTGNIKLLAKTGFISVEGVIVRLNRVDGTPLTKPDKQTHHDMDMVEKVYAPGQIVINKGDTVNFINKDAIQHNVFSSSGENAFDLGTFGGGLQRGVKLNEEGVVKIYCNIHPKMAAFVAVDDKGISQVVRTDDGAFQFSKLPEGEYQLTLWSIRGEQMQRLNLSTEKKVHLDLTFDTSNFEPPKPINKFGKQYKKKSVRREYY